MIKSRQAATSGLAPRPSPRARAARAGDDLVLLHLDRGTYYTLNPTGAFVWERLGDGATLGAVRDAIVEQFEVDAATAWRDLVELVGELEAEGLLVVAPAEGASEASD